MDIPETGVGGLTGTACAPTNRPDAWGETPTCVPNLEGPPVHIGVTGLTGTQTTSDGTPVCYPSGGFGGFSGDLGAF